MKDEENSFKNMKEDPVETINIKYWGNIVIPIFSLLPVNAEIVYSGNKTIVKMSSEYNLNGKLIPLVTFGKTECIGNTYVKEFGRDLAFRKASEAMEHACKKLLMQYSYENSLEVDKCLKI